VVVHRAGLAGVAARAGAAAAVDVGLHAVPGEVGARRRLADVHRAHAARAVGVHGARLARGAQVRAHASAVDVALAAVLHPVGAARGGTLPAVANLALAVERGAAGAAVGARGTRTAAVDVALVAVLGVIGAVGAGHLHELHLDAHV